MSKTVVLYHDQCTDGFGAAFAAWTVLGDQATYIPAQYGNLPPAEALVSERLYILDFSYSREDLLRLAELNRDGVTVIDHHKSAREKMFDADTNKSAIRVHEVGSNLGIIFDMEKSGAVLTWEYFHPGEPVPLLLQYVDDRDRWVWKLPRSRDFSATLKTHSMDFWAWHRLAGILNESHHFDRFCDYGKFILAAQRQHVDSLTPHAYYFEIEAGENTYWVPTVNCPGFLASEVGERLCELHPESLFSATYFLTQHEEVWSLRSRNGFDVSKVATLLGGGGHSAAAGFGRRRQ